MDSLREVFGQNLRRERKKQGLSEEKLSRKCGFHRTYIGKIERGESSPSLDTIEIIADALDVPASTLFEHEAKQSE